jgi:thymidine kinase
MTITAVLGEIGSGKSLRLLAYACEMANNKQKKLVLNFAVDLKALREYCVLMGYGWMCWLIDTNQILCLQLANYNQLLQIFSRPSTVVVVDEAQIFFNSRSYRNTPLDVLADLCLSRHDGIDVIWCAQVFEHVDAQFRQLTQYFIHSFGISKYDRELRNERLLIKCYFFFKGASYQLWLDDLKARRPSLRGFIRTYFMYAQKVNVAPVDDKDIKLFETFSSFNRLDKEKINNNSCHVYKFPFHQVSWNGVLPGGLDLFSIEKSLHISNEVEDIIITEEEEDTDKFKTRSSKKSKSSPSNQKLAWR